MKNTPKTMLAEFLALFNSVSKTGDGDIVYNEKMRAYLKDSNKNKHNDISIKKLLSNVFGKDKIDKKNAIEILKNTGGSSSKKYLIQATDIAKAIPDDMEDASYKKSMVKLIYIVPDKDEFVKKCEEKKISTAGIIVCGLNDLEYDNKCDPQICDYKMCRYYNWLKCKILNPIFNKSAP